MTGRNLVMLLAALAITGLVPVPAVGQSGNGADVGKTPWGDPDLQGLWSYATLTPLQRPAEVESRPFFTPEEVAARNLQGRTDRPDRPGVDPGSYNAFWVDRGEVLRDSRTSQIVDPPDGRLPLNAEGRQRVDAKREHRRMHPADSWLDRPIWDRCITYHGVPPVGTSYNNTYHILQTPAFVAIHVENIHDVRIIPLTGRPHLDAGIPQWNGDSRGYWDGDTLVVETRGYSDKSELRFPTTKNTRAVERFTRIDEHTIDYQFTVEDPEIYTQPFTVNRPFQATPDYVIYEYACHEGNYALPNIMAGERAAEAAAAQGSR